MNCYNYGHDSEEKQLTVTNIKTEEGVLSYGFNWGSWLEGDTLASSEWEDLDGGLTIEEDSFTAAGITSVKVSGGNDGEIHRLLNTITTTTNGFTDSRTKVIQINPKSN